MSAAGTALRLAPWMALAAGLAAGAEPPSYPLICKGGESMSIQVHHEIQSRRITAVLYVRFERAPQRAGAVEPGEGQCAFIDRPISEGEPRSLRIDFRNVVIYTDMSRARHSGWDSGAVGAEAGDRSVEGWNVALREATGVLDAIGSNRMFRVKAHNTENRFFTATEILD